MLIASNMQVSCKRTLQLIQVRNAKYLGGNWKKVEILSSEGRPQQLWAAIGDMGIGRKLQRKQKGSWQFFFTTTL